MQININKNKDCKYENSLPVDLCDLCAYILSDSNSVNFTLSLLS